MPAPADNAFTAWWNDAVTAMPLVQAWGVLRQHPKRERTAKMLLGVLSIYAFIALATPWWPALQLRLMASFHYQPPSLASWVILQPAPKMYGFANRVWRGSYPLLDPTTRKMERGRFDAKSFWVNHYPARMARYDGERRKVFAKPGRSVYVMMRSRYRDAALWSGLELREEQGALIMRPVEVVP